MACPHHPPLLTFESSSTQSYLQSYSTTLSSHHRERWRPWGHLNVDAPCNKHVHDLITNKHPYTLLGCALGCHYKVVQWISHSLQHVEVSPKVLAPTKPLRAPSCALWCLLQQTHTSPSDGSQQPGSIYTTSRYNKTSLYHILR
jgi:hypothetical protein